jgi:hypothetical protein
LTSNSKSVREFEAIRRNPKDSKQMADKRLEGGNNEQKEII